MQNRILQKQNGSQRWFWNCKCSCSFAYYFDFSKIHCILFSLQRVYFYVIYQVVFYVHCPFSTPVLWNAHFLINLKAKNHIHWTYFVLILQEVAGANDDHKFGLAAAGSDVATENKVEGDAIVLFKKFDEGRNDMTEDLVNVEAIGKFVAANALPLVVEFNHETAQKIFSGEIKSHLLMFVSKKSDEFKAQHETAQTIAKEYKGQLLFVTIGMFSVF